MAKPPACGLSNRRDNSWGVPFFVGCPLLGKAMGEEIEVIVAGLATVDLVAHPVPFAPPIAQGKLYPIRQVDLVTGGFVSNTATGLARLGIRTAALAAVGDDSWGRTIAERLAAEGIDIRGFERLPGQSTATTVVLVDSQGERSFLFAPGAAAHWEGAATSQALQQFPKARWFLFGYYSLFDAVDAQLATLFQRVRAAGLRTLLESAGHGGHLAPLADILPFVDCYLPSLEEARHQTGGHSPQEMVTILRHHGAAGIVGIKLGAAGAYVSLSPDDELHLPALAAPETVVDTTGAGDAFIAGLVAGFLRGLSGGEALRMAAATSAFCVTDYGATRGLRSWKATRELALADLH